ncbi:MAG: cytidylate kinase family protein [Geobacteraceae bacterium]|nr:cytidylate kinase family protein [Geobacteraceae bacterium]
MAIITISREMGTGAYKIAKDVAKKLKYTLVDGAKIAEVAEQYGLTKDILERIDEKPPVYITAEDRLNAAYLNMIELILLDFAKSGNVILYGRGCQDLLKGLGNTLKLRFTAPFEERVEKFAEREWLDPDLAHEFIRKSDHQRAGFIHFYFDRDWSDPLGYDLTFNTSSLSEASIIDCIVSAAKDPKLKDAEVGVDAFLEDIILAKKIETELLKSGQIESLHLKIASYNGKVHLAGHVQSDDELAEAVRIANSVAGVQAVKNDLHVVSFTRYKE